MRNTTIIKLAVLIGILLGVVLYFILPREALSENTEVIPIESVRVYHEKPDIKTYAKERVGNEWWAFNYIISHESGWNSNAQNPVSSAFGLAQFLNSTWEVVGCEKTTDKYTQIDASPSAA